MRNIIAVDIGNTETTVGIGSKDNWDSYRFTTRDTNTPDELLALFNSTFQIKSEVKKDIEGAIICSVVPQATNSFSEAIRKYLNLEPVIVGPGIKTGLKVNIDNPKELGPDRIANSVAGYLITETDTVVIDLGTATTFDVVSKNKEYLGGSIAPGIKISLDALTLKTASLKSVELDTPNKVIGKNTYEAIQSGLIMGHASMIDSMVEKIILEIDIEPKIILTGGLSKVVQPILNVNVEYIENLTSVSYTHLRAHET